MHECVCVCGDTYHVDAHEDVRSEVRQVDRQQHNKLGEQRLGDGRVLLHVAAEPGKQGRVGMSDCKKGVYLERMREAHFSALSR
jgi:hypothetical protein